MTICIHPVVGEALGSYRAAALAADARGDTVAARINQNAAADLLAQVKPPRLLPRDTDEALEWRAFAGAMTDHAWRKTRHSYDVVSRQGCYAQRLDAIVTQWGAQE